MKDQTKTVNASILGGFKVQPVDAVGQLFKPIRSVLKTRKTGE